MVQRGGQACAKMREWSEQVGKAEDEKEGGGGGGGGGGGAGMCKDERVE